MVRGRRLPATSVRRAEASLQPSRTLLVSNVDACATAHHQWNALDRSPKWEIIVVGEDDELFRHYLACTRPGGLDDFADTSYYKDTLFRSDCVIQLGTYSPELPPPLNPASKTLDLAFDFRSDTLSGNLENLREDLTLLER